MRSMLGVGVLLVAGIARAQGGAGGAAAPAPPKPGAIAGRVVIAPGVPASACKVTAEGASGTAACNTSGAFIVKDLPPGPYDLEVSVPSVGEARLSAGTGADQTTYLGDLRIGQPGAIGGRVTADNSADIDVAIIGIPELGVYTTPNVTGGYLLTGVPSGSWKVTLFPSGQSPSVQSVTLSRAQPIAKADFQIKTPPPGTTTSPTTPTP